MAELLIPKNKSKNNSSEENKSTRQVNSDAFPKTQKPKLKSASHYIMSNIIKAGKFSHKKLKYRSLSVQDQLEMKDLHEEWFPIEYPQSFFDRMLRDNVIAIGCFYEVDDGPEKVNNEK